MQTSQDSAGPWQPLEFSFTILGQPISKTESVQIPYFQERRKTVYDDNSNNSGSKNISIYQGLLWDKSYVRTKAAAFSKCSAWWQSSPRTVAPASLLSSKDCFSHTALAAALLGQAKFKEGVVQTLNSENVPFPLYWAVLGINVTRNQPGSIRLCSVPMTRFRKPETWVLRGLGSCDSSTASTPSTHVLVHQHLPPEK